MGHMKFLGRLNHIWGKEKGTHPPGTVLASERSAKNSKDSETSRRLDSAAVWSASPRLSLRHVACRIPLWVKGPFLAGLSLEFEQGPIHVSPIMAERMFGVSTHRQLERRILRDFEWRIGQLGLFSDVAEFRPPCPKREDGMIPIVGVLAFFGVGLSVH